jgi:hypothetical protein
LPPASGPVRTKPIKARLAQRTLYGARSDSPGSSVTSGDPTPLPTPTMVTVPPPYALEQMFPHLFPPKNIPPSPSPSLDQPPSRATQGLADRFCRVGTCAHHFSTAKDCRRHRDTHFRDRFKCPNPECDKSEGERGWFPRVDSLKRHWKSSNVCGAWVDTPAREVEDRGVAWVESELMPYDPSVHVAGAKGRRGVRG